MRSHITNRGGNCHQRRWGTRASAILSDNLARTSGEIEQDVDEEDDAGEALCYDGRDGVTYLPKSFRNTDDGSS